MACTILFWLVFIKPKIIPIKLAKIKATTVKTIVFHKPVARVRQFVLIKPRILVASVFSVAFVVYF